MLNNGASFGIDFVGLNMTSIILLLFIFFTWRKDRSNGWVIILLGGVMNLVERIINGGVNDYWKIPFTNIYNNFNDYLIFVGGIMVIWDKWKKSK